jgi:Phage capsid family
MQRALVPEDLHRGNGQALRSLVRAVIATANGTLDRQGLRPHAYAERAWPHDRDVPVLLRTAVAPIALADAPALAQVQVAFLAALVPLSAGADLLGRALSLRFDGAASINVPGIAPPVANFVAEMAPIPVSAAVTSAGPTLTPHKLAVITSLTSEMLRSSNAEELVRQALIESTGPALDAHLFSTAAAGPDRPPGLLNGITPLTPAAAGAKETALVDDLAALATAVAPVAGNGQIAIVTAPAQGVAIALRLAQPVPYNVMVSTSIATGTVIAIALPAIVSAGAGAPQIDASKQVAIQERTDPTSGLMTGSPARNIFQTDSAALRLRWPLTWARRDSRGVAFMTAVNW